MIASVAECYTSLPHPEGTSELVQTHRPEFDTAAYLEHAGLVRRVVQLATKPFFGRVWSGIVAHCDEWDAIEHGHCTALQIDREEMIRVMHEEYELSSLFLKFLLARRMRIQADLVDQLFNSSERRLARSLLRMVALLNTMAGSESTGPC
jgi:hypothetical protein